METYGTPYLFGYEQWALRQVRHRWAALSSHPDAPKNVRICDEILHADEFHPHAPIIRHARLNGRLGGELFIRPITLFQLGHMGPPASPYARGGPFF